MLEAKKSVFCEKIFAIYNKNLIRRKFHALNVRGLENLQNQSIPFLIYANHSSWWDGLAAFQICYFLQLDSFIMMEEKQLKNLQFFRRLGAFSIIRENPREAFESVEYAVNLLKSNSRKTVWIFPQGNILPNDLRPLNFFKGLSHIVKKVKNCAVVPLAFRYEFLGTFKPEIFVSVAEPIFFSPETINDKNMLTEIFVSNLTKTLDKLKKDFVSKNLTNFQNII
ncbi:MAG TPA: lysophospholipid acyltransferase family protein [Pyrinomonadaceae bacterium]|nr:lysophospholipid acyltransferase family protein [Pyrinomonadaceae bacterium]